jgi:anti-sigma factor RsiW
MRCRDFVAFIIDYLEKTLPEAQCLEFDRHMSDCPACVAYLRSYQETIRLERTLCYRPDDTLLENVPEDLVQAILAAKRKAQEG